MDALWTVVNTYRFCSIGANLFSKGVAQAVDTIAIESKQPKFVVAGVNPRRYVVHLRW
jgi:hypothetical protein